MKIRITFIIMLLLIIVNVKAQDFVSTESQNRNAIIEEFTGRNCQYCPAGHMASNSIMQNNPGRVWTVNIHAGNYAVTTYPNFITNVGNTIFPDFKSTVILRQSLTD